MRLLLNTRGKCEYTVPFGTNVTIGAKSCKSDRFSDRFKKERSSSVKQRFLFLDPEVNPLSHSEAILNSISNSIKNT